MPYDGESDLDGTTKVLLEARRLVEEGWCQGAYEDEAGRVCLQLALYLGQGASESQVTVGMSASDRVVKLIGPFYASATHPIQGWNDAPERTQAEVLELLDRAIADSESTR